jgi:hypothetical protein
MAAIVADYDERAETLQMSNDQALASWSAEITVGVSLGSNLIPVTVLAPNGVTLRHYYVDLTVVGDTRLASLDTVPAGLLTNFSPEKYTYSFSVNAAQAVVGFVPVVSDPRATIDCADTTGKSAAVEDNQTSVDHFVYISTNVMTVTVTSPLDNNTGTYSILVTRADATIEHETTLTSLAFSSDTRALTLTPAYSNSVNAYSAFVSPSATTVLAAVFTTGSVCPLNTSVASKVVLCAGGRLYRSFSVTANSSLGAGVTQVCA